METFYETLVALYKESNLKKIFSLWFLYFIYLCYANDCIDCKANHVINAEGLSYRR